MSKLKRLLCYESQHQRQSNEKSLVQFDYEKAASNYLGTQSTFKALRVEYAELPPKYGIQPTRVAAPSPRASLGRRTVCGRKEQHRPPVSKRYESKVRMVWGSFLIAAAALKTPTRNGYNAQGVNLTFSLFCECIKGALQLLINRYG